MSEAEMDSDKSKFNVFANLLNASPATRFAILGGVILFSLFGLHVEPARGATFRVDDSSLTVPPILSDDWRAVKLQRAWSIAGGKEIDGEPRFSRFLARDYTFSVSGPALRIKTTWFAAGKCVSTDEAVSTLNRQKRIAIESAVGSLDEMQHRLHENPGSSENRVIIWAHFKSDREVIVPVDTLSAEHAATLAPFVELAKQSFDARLFKNTKCKESEDSEEARETARSGGRRMRSPKSRSGARSLSTGKAPPRPTGGLVVGALPQAGVAPERPDRRVEDNSSEKQQWSILISQFVAKAGSLVFEPAGSFTRCVTARSEPEAIAMMRATYRGQVSSGNGKRTSYRVTGGGSGCGQSGSGGTGSIEPDGSGSPGSNVPSLGTPTVDPNDIDSFEPFPDPLELDPQSDNVEDMGDFDDFDLEAIPTSEEFFEEIGEGETDSTQPSIDTTESAES
ncbi:MAG: hypothetical protein ACI92S_005646 [Planctomycetaceae bacterium]|jgi:hypothetical protein